MTWISTTSLSGILSVVSLISSLTLGSEEMPIAKYVQLAEEKIVDAKYKMVELVGLAWGRELNLVLDQN